MFCASNAKTIYLRHLVLLLLCSIPALVHAQVAGGNISGTVTDSSARVIGNVQIKITNVATGVTREVTTNDEGFYSAPNLLPGTYEVKFAAPGFRSEVHKNIEVTVGASVALDQTLRVGSLIETVEVQSEVPAVQTSSSDISSMVNATTVRELPLNGRSWTDLAQLQAGVSAIHAQPDFSAGTDRGNRGFGQQLTISGARPQQNNYRLDGVSLNDYANGAPGSVLGGSLGVDAIEEFSVITSNLKVRGFSLTQGGFYSAIPYLAIALASPLGGQFSDFAVRRFGKRLGQRLAVWVGIFSSAILLWEGAHAGNKVTAILLLAAAAGCNMFAAVTFWAACIDLGREYSASVAGLMNTFGNLGGFFSPIVTAYIASAFGWTSALTLAACVTVVSGLSWLAVDSTRGIGDLDA
jgi:hypothetical protein